MDKRKNNGGHSTKTTGLDKRKNEYRNALGLAAGVSDVEKVLREILKQSKGGDLTAAKLFLSYYLGTPIQTIENTNINYNTGDLTGDEIELLRKDLDNKY